MTAGTIQITGGTMIVIMVCAIQEIANQIWKRFAGAWQSRGFETRKIAAQIAIKSFLLPHKHPGVALVSPLGYNVTHLQNLRLTKNYQKTKEKVNLFQKNQKYKEKQQS